MSTTTRAVTDRVSPERLLAHLEWFAQVRRDTGGPGETKAAEYIAGQLQTAGVPVQVHEFDAYLSYPVRATLEVVAPTRMQLPCLTHSFGRSTGPDGVVADLLYLPDGDVTRGAGRACMVDGLATPVTILRAGRAGCAAVVFANQDRVLHNMIGTTIWGTPALDQVDRLPHVPVVTVNLQSGETLKRLLADSGRATVRIVTEVKTGWVRSRLPEARIRSSAGTAAFVLVGGHYCSWNAGVTDNATGDACLLEMARILWERRGDLRRNVRICWWPGHSHGRYSGSTWYADTFFTELAEHCLAYHNIDSPGVRGATQYVARHTTAELEQFCRTMVEGVTGQAQAPVHRPSRAADQSFLANGVPSFSAYPFLPDDHPDRRAWTGGSASAWWWHTEFDTLDKADPQILALDTREVPNTGTGADPKDNEGGRDRVRLVFRTAPRTSGLHLGHAGELHLDDVRRRLGLREVPHFDRVSAHVGEPPGYVVLLILTHLGFDVRQDPLALPLARVPRRLVEHRIALADEAVDDVVQVQTDFLHRVVLGGESGVRDGGLQFLRHAHLGPAGRRHANHEGCHDCQSNQAQQHSAHVPLLRHC